MSSSHQESLPSRHNPVSPTKDLSASNTKRRRTSVHGVPLDRRSSLDTGSTNPFISPADESDEDHITYESSPYAQVPNVADGNAFQSSSKIYQISIRSTQDSIQPLKRIRTWRAPLIMLISFLLGLGFAIVHHEMNNRLNGKMVNSLGSGSSQLWTSRYATALVFLVRASLVTCVGTAFVQRQWLIFSSHRQTISIQDFDTISSALSSIMSIFSFVWLKHPLLLILFLISLSMPFAVIAVPASLSISPTPFLSTISQTKLSPAYKDTALYTVLDCCGQQGELIETTAVSRIAFETATSGRIVAAQPLYPNITFSTTFIGPALRCFNANATVTDSISQRVMNGGTNPDQLLFWSWTGDYQQNVDYNQSTSLPSWGCSPDAAHGCNIFVLSGLGKGTTTNITIEGEATYYQNLNVTECRLNNATYEVNYSFLNNIPNITISNITYLNAVWNPYNDDPINNNRAPFDDDMANSYLGIMSALGNILVGSADRSQYGYIKRQTHYDLLKIEWKEADAMTSGLQEFFQNFTVGMLSVSSLLANSTELDPATVTTWYNTFVYNSIELLLPYGVALALSLTCAIVGMHAFLTSHDSYQNKFSSFVRAAHGIDFKDSIAADDTGADPLPKRLSKQRITLGHDYNEV